MEPLLKKIAHLKIRLFVATVIDKLNKITFFGFALCVVLPIMEVKYRYVHSYSSEPNDSRGLMNIWNALTEHWDGVNFLFGFHPEVMVVPVALILQGIILLKDKKQFQRVGDFLDDYRTYIFLLIAIIINLYLIDDAYDSHRTKFYFWFGGYIFLGLILANGIVKLKQHLNAKKK